MSKLDKMHEAIFMAANGNQKQAMVNMQPSAERNANLVDEWIKKSSFGRVSESEEDTEEDTEKSEGGKVQLLVHFNVDVDDDSVPAEELAEKLYKDGKLGDIVGAEYI